MSQGKENAATLSCTLRGGRVRIPNSRYADDEGTRGGRGRARGGGRAGGGRVGGGVDLQVEASQLPSASGDVASEL